MTHRALSAFTCLMGAFTLAACSTTPASSYPDLSSIQLKAVELQTEKTPREKGAYCVAIDNNWHAIIKNTDIVFDTLPLKQAPRSSLLYTEIVAGPEKHKFVTGYENIKIDAQNRTCTASFNTHYAPVYPLKDLAQVPFSSSPPKVLLDLSENEKLAILP